MPQRGGQYAGGGADRRIRPLGAPAPDREPRAGRPRVVRPYRMAQVRGIVAERLAGDAAWEVIDRISHKYTGQPYPRGEDRVVFLVEPERAWGLAFG